MYCNHCGGEVQPNQRFCGSCGKPAGVPAAPPPMSPSAGRVGRHVKICGVLDRAIGFEPAKSRKQDDRRAGDRRVGTRLV